MDPQNFWIKIFEVAILVTDADTKQFNQHLRETFKKKWNGPNEILVEFYMIPQEIIPMAYFANVLAKKHEAKIKSFSITRGNRLLYQSYARKFFKTFKAFNSVGFVSSGHEKADENEINTLFRFCQSKIQSKKDLLELRLLDIPVGVDIYESYLREKNKPTININDPDVFEFIRECIHDIVFWKKYFKDHSVKALVLSHGIYRYGMLSRVAHSMGIEVFVPTIRSINRSRVIKDGLKDIRYVDFFKFPEDFKKLDIAVQTAGVALAKQQLERRLFKGEVGVNMPYSSRSAYTPQSQSTSNVLPVISKDERLKVLIAAHCFFDNPHAYGGNLFEDFYEWVCFLGNLSNQTDYAWYIKTHPDTLPGNIQIWEELLKKFPRFQLVPKTTSFHQLVADGLSHVLTTYGSVGHELPLLGVTVINAGLNPHVGFDFTITPQSIEEYESLILRLPDVKKVANPEEIYQFFYTSRYTTEVNDDFMFPSYYQLMKEMGPDKSLSSEYYNRFLSILTTERKETILKKMAWFIEQKKDWFQNYEYERYQAETPK